MCEKIKNILLTSHTFLYKIILEVLITFLFIIKRSVCIMAHNDKVVNAGISIQREIPIYDAVDMLEDSIECQLEGEKMAIPTLCGRPGIAKTSHIEELAERLNLKLLYCSMNKPYEYFTGLPESEKGKNVEDSFVYWSKPELVHYANKYSKTEGYKGCLIFLDDVHIMTEDVQKIFYEFVLERKINVHRLNPNVAIVAAMNSEEIAGFDGFMSPINNRLQKIKVYMPFKYWYTNCGAGLNPLVASYLRNNTDAAEEAESTSEPFATYRSWTILSKLLDKTYNKFYQNRKKDMILTNEERNELVNKLYVRAASFVSSKNALNFKENISMQLRYDFEGMVKHNRFTIDHDDAFAALAFGNIVRYITTEKDVSNLIEFLNKTSETLNYNSFKNTIINIMLEILALLKYNNAKHDKSRSKEDKEKITFYNHFMRAMFNDTTTQTHAVINDFMNQ